MDKQSIKDQNTMRDVLARYNLTPNRAGFISCPFHRNDRTASMKIYRDSYHCFGCGAHGDIFSFVQNMDNCDFKTAFGILGGTYQKPTFSSKMAIYHHKKQMEMRKKEEDRKKQEFQQCLHEIDTNRELINNNQPLSDEWCKAWNQLQLALYHHGELTEVPY